jgi:hypothetical protein
MMAREMIAEITADRRIIPEAAFLDDLTIRRWKRWTQIEVQAPETERTGDRRRCRRCFAKRLSLTGPWHKSLYNSRMPCQTWPLQLLCGLFVLSSICVNLSGICGFHFRKTSPFAIVKFLSLPVEQVET